MTFCYILFGYSFLKLVCEFLDEIIYEISTPSETRQSLGCVVIAVYKMALKALLRSVESVSQVTHILVLNLLLLNQNRLMAILL